jgi:hypothetical protein
VPAGQISRGSGAPAGTGKHTPKVPGKAQLWQAPAHAVLQQTPVAQWPLKQS